MQWLWWRWWWWWGAAGSAFACDFFLQVSGDFDGQESLHGRGQQRVHKRRQRGLCRCVGLFQNLFQCLARGGVFKDGVRLGRGSDRCFDQPIHLLSVLSIDVKVGLFQQASVDARPAVSVGSFVHDGFFGDQCRPPQQWVDVPSLLVVREEPCWCCWRQ